MLSEDLTQKARSRGVRKQITIGTTETVYFDYPAQETGSKTLVMIHGYRGNHRGLEAIAGAMPDYRILIPDLPGFGESSSFTFEHSVKNYASWLRNFLEELGISESAHLVGHSFGTLVVGSYARQYPCQSVTLINPVSAPALSGPRAMFTLLARIYYLVGAALPEKLGGVLLRSRLAVRLMSGAMAKTDSKELRNWIHQQHLKNFSDFASVKVAVEGFEASISQNLSQIAADIASPVLLIVSEFDDITALDRQLEVAKLYKNATVREIKAVGHLVHYEAPESAAKFITEYLEAR